MSIRAYVSAMLLTMVPAQAFADDADLKAAAENSVFEKSFRERRVVQLDAAEVPELTEEVTGAPVLVRLHSGVFDFSKAAPDGSDLRFVSSDGTPLDYHIERFDPVASLALIWVQIPSVEPAVSQQVWLYYSDDTAMRMDDSRAVYDGEFAYVLNMNEDASVPVDQTANENRFAASGITPTLGGMVAGGMELRADSTIRATADRALNVEAGTGQLTWSAWINPQPVDAESGVAADGLIYTKLSTAGETGASRLELGIRDGELYAALGEAELVADMSLAADLWTHVAVVADGQTLRLLANGAVLDEAPAAMPELGGEDVIGAVGEAPGFVGRIDEVRRSNTARSPSFIALGARTEGRNANFVRVAPDGEATRAGEHNYFAILFNALTPDAWAVIVILAVMSAISWLIMFSKAGLLGRTRKANRAFYNAYQDATHGEHAEITLTDTEFGAKYPRASLARLFRVGQSELLMRNQGTEVVSPEEVASIRSALDAAQAREEQYLGKRMVLLTIAISGGPFLGLLGTVLGVMITFAGVAAAGEVNVTAIAPGIAAALLATVAGLAVAIPALFGYNYLNGQLERLLTDNLTFVDQLEKRIAETYRPSRRT
ncbi:MAG: DUF2341 domain-containing protein [Hyphomonadaceae bacterium]|nr:DUF2341 domain-containing protein [Hyphomonadaceae bacterium]